MKYFTNSTVGILVAGNNTPGNDSHQLNSLKGVAVDQSGAVIVADSGNYRIQKFVSGSTVGITLASNSTSIVKLTAVVATPINEITPVCPDSSVQGPTP